LPGGLKVDQDHSTNHVRPFEHDRLEDRIGSSRTSGPPRRRVVAQATQWGQKFEVPHDALAILQEITRDEQRMLGFAYQGTASLLFGHKFELEGDELIWEQDRSA
jgi:hypothetical protein